MSIESVMPSNHLILCRPLLQPSIFPIIKVFSNESALRMRWPKYWSFSFNFRPSNEHPGLISFRIVSFQHHNLKSSVVLHSAFFMVQLSHLYLTTGKTIALTIQTFVRSNVSDFLLLSRFVIAFLPKSNCLLISCLQSGYTLILETSWKSGSVPLFPHLFAMK